MLAQSLRKTGPSVAIDDYTLFPSAGFVNIAEGGHGSVLVDVVPPSAVDVAPPVTFDVFPPVICNPVLVNDAPPVSRAPPDAPEPLWAGERTARQ